MNLVNDYEVDLTSNRELQKFFIVDEKSFITFFSQSSSDQRFVIVISRKSKTTTSLTSDIEALTLIRKSVTILSSSTDQIVRRSNRLTKRN